MSISRIARVIKRWADRFVRRVYTADEARTCNHRATPASSFALRFAAKEAFSKALGLGMTEGVRWRDIEVIHDPGGRPGLRLHGVSSKICQDRGITSIHLSLSDEGEYATATVILEKDER